MSQAVTEMDYGAVLKALPHRPPFLLIDKVVDIVADESATGIRAVSSNEPYFAGHFPGHPVMPGVLIIEALLELKVKKVSARGPLWKFTGEAHVEGKKVTQCEFSAMMIDPQA